MTCRAAALMALLLLSACATTEGPPASAPPTAQAAPVTAEFRTADFAWSTAAGAGRIEGALAYRAKGETYACGGAGVLLTPQTPWTRERMRILYRSADYAALPAAEVRGRTPPGRSSDYSAFVRRAACDAQGRFAFAGLPDGAWYVITVAKSAAASGAPEMAIMRRVTTRGGKVIQVKL